MLENQFREVLLKYSDNTSTIKDLWREVEANYNKVYRHYHTLNHISHFLDELEDVKHQIKDWDSTVLAMYYHDIIFLPTRNDNEKSSSDVAEVSLSLLDISWKKIAKCQQMILATKSHERTNDSDTNFFIDADLSIIGSDEDTYSSYVDKIRNEYYYLSEDAFKSGRKRIVVHLLGMDKLYKTQYFYSKYEKQARKNLSDELKTLN